MDIPQGRSSQFNQFTETLLRYLMEQNLMGERQQGQMDYLDKQMEGWDKSSAARHGNAMELEAEKLRRDIIKMPEMKRNLALAADAQAKGQDPTKFLTTAKDIAKKRMKFYLQNALGVPIESDALESALEGFMNEDELRIMVPQAAASARTRMTTGEQAKTTALSERKLEEVEKPKLELEQSKFDAENQGGGKVGRDYYKMVHPKIMAVINFLSRKREEPDAIAAEEARLGIKRAGVMDEKSRVSLIAELSKLDTKAQSGKLTDAELAKVDNAWNIYGAQEDMTAPQKPQVAGPDQYGFTVGQVRVDAYGKQWQYLGNNQWTPAK